MEEAVCANQCVTYTLDLTDFNMIDKKICFSYANICIIFLL